MAYFAQLDENNIVIQVIYVVNDAVQDEQGIEKEEVGISFCKQLYGQDTKWLQTSFNSKIRGTFASVGYGYDQSKDAFIPPKPEEFPSWILDANFVWQPPIPYPMDGKVYDWNEETQTYIENTNPRDPLLPISHGTQDF